MTIRYSNNKLSITSDRGFSMIKNYPAGTRLVPFITGYGPFSISLPLTTTDKYNK